MDICVHLTSGMKYLFKQEDEIQVNAMFQSFHPMSLYSRSEIVIQGAASTRGFPSDSVECIEFITDLEAGWQFRPGLENLIALSEETYKKREDVLCGKVDELRKLEKPGNKINGLAEFVMKSRKKILFEYTAVTKAWIDQIVMVQHFMRTPAVYAKREQGGYLLVHTKNVDHWVLVPGPAAVPRLVWSAELSEGQEAPGACQVVCE